MINKSMINKSRCLSLLSISLLILIFAASADCGADGDLAAAARLQIGKTLIYDADYQTLSYPNGDLPIERGVCTDVVIRALRSAFDLDLQKMVHEDMQKNFSRYPRKWGLKEPDKNIDHRRVPNLMTFFKRSGWALDVSSQAENFKPGDIVTCIVPLHRPHIMIVSDKTNGDGIPLVIHNIGAGVQEEDRLFEFEHTGHFRIAGVEHQAALPPR